MHAASPFTLAPQEMPALLAGVRRLPAGAAAARPFEGRHVAVLGPAPDTTAAAVFGAAAAALGARVATIRPDVLRLGEPAGARAAAALLGRLYCAIACDGLGDEAAAWLAAGSGVPVFDAIGAPTHPARLLGDLLAMCEHAGKTPGQITLCVDGALQGPLAAAWHALAAATGLRVLSGPAGSKGHRSSDFCLRTCGAHTTDLVALDPAGGPPGALGARRRDGHRRILQAMLTRAVG